MKEPLRLFALFAGLGLLVTFAACFEYIDTSKNLACEQDSDCWDNLPCVRKICGAEPKPEPPPKPEARPGDGGETPQPELPQDIPCQVPGGSIKLCADDASCKSGTCGEFMVPGCSKPSKACTCAKDDDCKSNEKCCTFGDVGVCSSFGCTAP